MIEHSTSWLDSKLFSLALPNLGAFPSSLNLPSPHFVCLLACDARVIDRALIFDLANALLQQGLVYLCAWGPDCQRVHDLFDFAIIEHHSAAEKGQPVIMTTYHDGESLDEALWFLLNAAFPNTGYTRTCHSKLAVSIANDEWASQIQRRFDDPEGFDQEMLEALGRGDL